MRKKACLAAAVVLALIVGSVVGLLALRAKAGANYPTTPEGWAARFEAAVAEFGRTPGENWDRWLSAKAVVEDEDDAGVVAGALDELRDAERFTIPVPPSIGTDLIIDDLFPEFGVIRDTLREVVAPRIGEHLEAGEIEAAAAWIERAWVLARVSEASGTLLGVMVQVAVLDAVRAEVAPHAAEIARNESRRIEELFATAPHPNPVWALRLEREMVLSLASRMDSGVLTASDQRRLIEELFTGWAAYLETGDTAARDRVLAIVDRFENDPLFRTRRPALDMLMPPFQRFSRLVTSVEAKRDALLVLIALERWRAANGHYPDSIQALIPGVLPELPPDPFSDGEPFRYRLINAGASEPHRAFVLYSVGINRSDEGGIDDPALPERGLTDPEHAGDFVFNPAPAAASEDAEAPAASDAPAETDP